MINLNTLIAKEILISEAQDHMNELLAYYTDHPVDFSDTNIRTSFANFISEPERYDKVFDYTGEFVDLNTVANDEGLATQIFQAFSEEEQNEFKNKKPQDPIFEPSYKFITVKEVLPDTTLLVRFVGEGQFGKVQQHGFSIGTQNMNKLHVPRMYSIESKEGGGYIYGYVANEDEAKQQSKTDKAGQSYGTNAIFFKYGGLKVFNKLDDEDQVIIYGPDIQADECIFAEGTPEGLFIIKNGGFDKTPKTYSELVKLLGKI